MSRGAGKDEITAADWSILAQVADVALRGTNQVVDWSRICVSLVKHLNSLVEVGRISDLLLMLLPHLLSELLLLLDLCLLLYCPELLVGAEDVGAHVRALV